LINRTPLLLGTSAVAGDVFRDADSIAEDQRRFRIGRPHVEIHVGSLAGKTLLVAGTHAAAPFHDHSVGNHFETIRGADFDHHLSRLALDFLSEFAQRFGHVGRVAGSNRVQFRFAGLPGGDHRRHLQSVHRKLEGDFRFFQNLIV
jgi:hypothetical protein